MKFIGVREFRNKSSALWKQLNKEKELIVTSNGKPVAILSAVSEENLEENLNAIRQARAIRTVASIQKQSVEKGMDRISAEEIEQEIAAVRRERAS